MEQSLGNYRAFLSYSRKDEVDAAWLQDALEDYRFPRRLHVEAASEGQSRALGRIFRDRSGLSVSENLEDALSEALANSENLIVLCTPEAMNSIWVDREIRLFRQLHPERKIVAALFRGDEACAFPPALRESHHGVVSPLAADFRPEGDGRKLALLKVIAGLSGVSMGELVHREQSRRLRQLGFVSAISVAGMAIFAAISLFALNAKREAEAERAKSEQLVEALVTDLRGAVKPVGSLSLLDRINEAAVRYFRGQSLDDLPDAALAQRARLLIAMGEDELARGQMQTASTHFLEAHRTTGARLAESPDDPPRMFDHGQSEYWLGYAAWQAGDIDAADAHFQRYAELSDRLVRLAPTNSDWQMEAGHAAINRGVLALRGHRNLKSAGTYFGSGLLHFREAGRLGNSAAGVEISNAIAWLADIHRVRGEWIEARQLRVEQLELADAGLRNSPRNLDLRRERLGALLAIARIDADSGKHQLAEAGFAVAEKDANALLLADPEALRNRHQLEMTRLQRSRNQLMMPKALQPRLEKVASTIAGCRSETVRENDELLQFCRLVLARLYRVSGKRANADALISAVSETPISKTLSENWGIAFPEEIASVASIEQNGNPG